MPTVTVTQWMPQASAVVFELLHNYSRRLEWLSTNALRNPMPGGPALRATVPNGRIDIFNDRWAWTNNSSNGMLQIWTGFSAGQRSSENNKTMYSGAAAYSFDTGGLPIE